MPRKSQEQLRAEWWNAWWMRDFSWEGLAQQRLPGWHVTRSGKLHRSTSGAKPATLQDVWRAEAERLIEGPDGLSFTAVHVPHRWRDGSAIKLTNADHTNAVEQAFAAAMRRFKPEDLRDPTSPALTPNEKGRLPSRVDRYNGFPLDGVVLQELSPHLSALPKWRGDYVAFVSPQTIQAMPESLQLRRALFESDLVVDATQMSGGDFSLVRALAMRGLTIESGQARAVIIRGLATFGPVTIDDLNIQKDLSIRFGRFEDYIELLDVKSGLIDLLGCEFDEEVTVSESTGIIDMRQVVAGKMVSIRNVDTPRFSARDLVVKGDLNCSEFTVSGNADFAEASFGQRVKFDRSSFKEAVFDGATFGAKANFSGTKFTGQVSFAGAHFHGPADFSQTQWPNSIDDQEGAFRETRFDSFADFQNTAFQAFSAFNGSTAKAEIRFDRKVVDSAAFAAALRHATTDKQREALEHGFRALKQAAESVRDRNLEQAFFRAELLARRKQNIGYGERILSTAYEWASNYGSSCWRPLAWALLAWFIFAGIYLALAKFAGAPVAQDLSLTGDRLHPAVFEALGLSARSMFNLFGIWTLRIQEGGGIGAMFEAGLLRDNPPFALAARLISTGQSFISGMLLFLVALAARRRFQIS